MYSVRVRTNLILIRAYILKKSFVIGGKLEVNSYNPYMITLLIACGIVLLLAHYMNIMKEVMSVRGGVVISHNFRPNTKVLSLLSETKTEYKQSFQASILLCPLE